MGVYSYMDEWETFNETSLPKKEEFYSNLNMEDITDTSYMHAKKVCKYFEIRKLGVKYPFGLMLLKTYKTVFRNLSVRPCKIFPEPGLPGKVALKRSKLQLLIDIGMLLMVQKGIRSRTCPSINTYVNDNNKYMKDYDNKNESSVLKYWDINNLYCCDISQSCL